MMFYLSNYVGAGVLDSPPPSTFHIIVYHTNLDNRTNVGRGEHCSPVSSAHSNS